MEFGMLRKPRFGHKATEELFHYWDGRREGRPAPDRSDIEPSDIRTILPDAFILEVDANHGYSWRLAGTRVCALHCRELKGRDFLADWHGEERATLTALLDAVVREAAVAIIQIDYVAECRKTLEAEMVLLPLRVFARPIWPSGIPSAEEAPKGAPEPDPIAQDAERARRYRHLMVLDGGKT
jgi:hypothetical protein